MLQVGPVTYMFLSFAAPVAGPDSSAHSTGDIYSVGATTHPTGLAVSTGGENFAWQGEVLPVGNGWNRYQARLTSVLPVPGGYLGFYDGSTSHEENYEERPLPRRSRSSRQPVGLAPRAQGHAASIACRPVDDDHRGMPGAGLPGLTPVHGPA